MTNVLLDACYLRLVLAILAQARRDLESTNPDVYLAAVWFIQGSGCRFWCEVLQQPYSDFVKECECLTNK
jgi:hypothetical protein